ncbi:hypothetical protein MKX03_027084 [Papaver bracteatum]|nr:hypothetical protein MKX03_027084 [Papaver bracteatum]
MGCSEHSLARVGIMKWNVLVLKGLVSGVAAELMLLPSVHNNENCSGCCCENDVQHELSCSYKAGVRALELLEWGGRLIEKLQVIEMVFLMMLKWVSGVYKRRYIWVCYSCCEIGVGLSGRRNN